MNPDNIDVIQACGIEIRKNKDAHGSDYLIVDVKEGRDSYISITSSQLYALLDLLKILTGDTDGGSL